MCNAIINVILFSLRRHTKLSRGDQVIFGPVISLATIINVFYRETLELSINKQLNCW